MVAWLIGWLAAWLIGWLVDIGNNMDSILIVHFIYLYTHTHTHTWLPPFGFCRYRKIQFAVHRTFLILFRVYTRMSSSGLWRWFLSVVRSECK